MQVCTLLQTDNHASTPPLSFFTGRMPFLPPNQQWQSTIGRLEQKCFQLMTKSTGRPQQLQLYLQPVPCSRCGDRESPVAENVCSAEWQVTLCGPTWHVSSHIVAVLHCELLMSILVPSAIVLLYNMVLTTTSKTTFLPWSLFDCLSHY